MQIFDKLDPKGYVVIKDKDGKIIRANFNTIVNEGKKIIISKLFPNIFFNDSSNINKSTYEGYEFYGLCFGQSLNETTINYAYDSSEYVEILPDNANNPLFFHLNENTSNVSEFNIKYDEETKRYYLAITIRVIPGSDLITDYSKDGDSFSKNSVCSLAIIMKNDNIDDINEKYKLFSRFRFDPLPVTSDSEFILTYYIYF